MMYIVCLLLVDIYFKQILKMVIKEETPELPYSIFLVTWSSALHM